MALSFADVPPWLFPALALFCALCLGSLATALAWRLPRGLSIVAPRSRCTSCGRVLGAGELVPVVSWILQRGRCRGCGQFYGWRYLLIEVSTAALCMAFFVFLPAGWWLIPLFVASALLMAHLAIDLEAQLLLDVLNGALAVLGYTVLALVALFDAGAGLHLAGEATLGAALYAAVAFLLRAATSRFLGREAMGLGDVKFFAVAGVWLGSGLGLLSSFMMLSGALGVILGLVWRWRIKADVFPFGPALILTLIIFLLSGHGLTVEAIREYGNAL